MRKLAQLIGRQPWMVTVGPHFAKVDNLVQRWTGGWLSVMRLAGLTSVLLTTTGRKSGLPRSAVLLAIPDDGGLLVVASNFGKPGEPAWSANLIANPDATVHMRGRGFAVRATLLTGRERTEAWARAAAVWPGYDGYATRTDREIKVFRLARPPLRN
jgi:deazaflavin-dependent oxidoreductase (nitroreductase family)